MDAQHNQSMPIVEHFAAPVERVFGAWHNAPDLERWAWGSLGNDARAESDFRVGGAYAVSTLGNDGNRWSFAGTFTTIEPNRRIEQTLVWDAPMGYPPEVEYMTAEFAADADGTTVTFDHRGNLSEASLAEHARGWRNAFATLRKHLEGETADGAIAQ